MLWMQLVKFHIVSKCLRRLINFTFRLILHLIYAITVFFRLTQVDQINVSANLTTCYSQLSDGFMREKVTLVVIIKMIFIVF